MVEPPAPAAVPIPLAGHEAQALALDGHRWLLATDDEALGGRLKPLAR